VAVFTATGSINQAAKACGVSHGLARRLLVAQGLVAATRQPVGKAEAKRRFFELLASGWSPTRAAREVGVHERTGRDWRDGIRKVRNTRVRVDGTVIDYSTGTRYTQPVNTERSRRAQAGVPEISSRYLSLPDRLAIAGGLQASQKLTVIAAGIGKHPSTVSREIGDRNVDGLYLPYRPMPLQRRPVLARSSPNWSPTTICARRCKTGCRGDCRPNRSLIASSRISRTTRACG
jgi:hypothetical protein